jgi:hypothetical protein
VTGPVAKPEPWEAHRGWQKLLSTIAEAVDDGFYPAASLASDFPKLSHREIVRLRKGAVRQGLIFERRGPDRRAYLALTSEGWRALRALQGRP